MKKKITALVLLLVSLSALAIAGTKFANLEEELKTRVVCYAHEIPAGDSAVTAGAEGVLSVSNANLGTTAVVMGSFVKPQIPMRVGVQIQDVNNDDTLTCSAFTLTGRTMNGSVYTETLTVTEAATYTTRAYKEIVAASGTCTGGDTSDYVIAHMSPYPSPAPLASTSDVVSACEQTAAGVATCLVFSTIAALVNTQYDYLDLSATLADGDRVCITVRPSFK